MEDIGVMSREGVEEARESNTLGVHKRKQAEQSIERCEPLLPGIPDEITIDVIAPKLPCTTIPILSLVSHAWRQAVHSREVYNSRVRSKSTQPLVAVRELCDHSRVNKTITFLSIEDGSYYHLPPIPSLNERILRSSRRIVLDGKLYVLGGHVSTISRNACAEVYVCDVVGRREWKQCASMGKARDYFGCGVKDGKIYVFGGCDCGLVLESEVYDPKKDAWSPISPVPIPGIEQKVTTVGDELFVHGTKYYYQDRPRSTPSPYRFCAEAYHPLRDSWRIVENFNTSYADVVLTAGGKLHKLTQYGFQVFDSHSSSWKPMQTFSFGEHEVTHSFKVDPFSAMEVNDEILALVVWRNTGETNNELLFIRSQGVGGETKEILWHKLQCSSSIDYRLSCVIQI